MPVSGNKLSGTTYWIGTTAANGASDSYTKIGGARQVGGSTGYVWQSQDTTHIEHDYRKTTKTVRDGSNLDLEVQTLIGDAGQAALKAAAADTSDGEYNFEVRYAQGDKERLKIKVFTYEPQQGNAGATRVIRQRLEIQAEAEYVAA